MYRIFCLALIVALCGCTSSRPMMAPSGAQGHKIWCELPSQCYQRAAKTCPYGYNIEANEKDYWGLGDIDGNLIITCKQATQAAAELAPVASPPTATGHSGTAQSTRWWDQHRPAQPAAQPTTARYKCTDVDGNPYVTTSPTKGCVVE